MDRTCFFNDPQSYKWGANLDNVINGGPISNSDLIRTRRLTKYCPKDRFQKCVPQIEKVQYPVCGDALTDQSDYSSAWQYRNTKSRISLFKSQKMFGTF